VRGHTSKKTPRGGKTTAKKNLKISVQVRAMFEDVCGGEGVWEVKIEKGEKRRKELNQANGYLKERREKKILVRAADLIMSTKVKRMR